MDPIANLVIELLLWLLLTAISIIVTIVVWAFAQDTNNYVPRTAKRERLGIITAILSW